MAYPGQPGGHGHGPKHGDDHGHYPEEELLKQMGNRAYSLTHNEKENVDEIERQLKSGNRFSHDELHQFQHYLEHASHELKEILQEEQEDHIHNLQLEKDLRRVAQLLGEVSMLLERHHH